MTAFATRETTIVDADGMVVTVVETTTTTNSALTVLAETLLSSAPADVLSARSTRATATAMTITTTVDVIGMEAIAAV